jgi:predicted Rossmann fold nucleotide-binding protein DprA/Smf involved in DNA uptake
MAETVETVGFTGTRSVGMADLPRIRQIVEALPDGTMVVTGACIGVDAAVARVANRRDLIVHTIVPADRSRVDPKWLCHVDTFEELPDGTTYRDRNARIVALSDRLIAIPDHAEHDPESRRSGTWQTIRLARRAGKPVEIHVLCRACRPAQRSGGGSEG